MSFDLEKLRTAYKSKAHIRKSREEFHHSKPESLAEKLGYYDIDYTDSQLDPNEVLEVMTKKHNQLKSELEGSNTKSRKKDSWL